MRTTLAAYVALGVVVLALGAPTGGPDAVVVGISLPVFLLYVVTLLCVSLASAAACYRVATAAERPWGRSPQAVAALAPVVGVLGWLAFGIGEPGIVQLAVLLYWFVAGTVVLCAVYLRRTSTGGDGSAPATARE